MSDAMMWGLAGLFVGYLLTKKKDTEAASSPTASNEIEKTADWWTYAGSWA